MCSVDKPKVYFTAESNLKEFGWLFDVDKINKAGRATQSEQWKGDENPDVPNNGLYNVAKAFFSKKNQHSSAIFVPYGAVINQEHFGDASKLPIDYFYRLLVKAGTDSHWSPLKTNHALDIWDDANKYFKTVFYSFMGGCCGEANCRKGTVTPQELKLDDVKDKSNQPLTIQYHTITLHEAPFIYWLRMPEDPQQFAQSNLV